MAAAHRYLRRVESRLLADGFTADMLADLVREGLATAIVGKSVKAGGNTVEVVHFWITDDGRTAIEE